MRAGGKLSARRARRFSVLFRVSLLAAACFVARPWALSGQTLLGGVVTDCAGTPIAGLIVTISGPAARSAITASDGRFLVEVPPGNYTVTLQRIGLSGPTPISITLAGGQSADLGLIPLGCDYVRLQGLDPGPPPFFLFDGRVDAGSGPTCVNDRVHVDNMGFGSALMLFSEDVLPGGPCSSELAFFAADHAPVYLPAPAAWSPARGDLLQRTLGPPIGVHLALWIVAGDTGIVAATNQAILQAMEADLLFRTNRVGVTFSWTTTPAFPGLSVIGSGCDDGEEGGLSSSMWYTPGEINVYVVQQAMWEDGATGTVWPVSGVNCGFDRNVIYLSRAGDVTTLAHELGHAFGFRCFTDSTGTRRCRRQHTDLTYTVTNGDPACTSDADPAAANCQPPPPCPGFTDQAPGVPGCQPFAPTNIMWPEASGRTGFTLGQLYQMRLEGANQLRANGLLGPPSKPCRVEQLFSADLCPLLWLEP